MRQYLEKGCSLQVTDQNEAAYDDIRGQFSTEFVHYLPPCELANQSKLKTWLKANPFHKLPDLVVLNAGLANLGLFEDFSWDQHQKLLGVNLLAPMQLFHYFLPKFKARGSGQFLLISSVAGQMGPGYLSSYAASKFGLRGFGEAMLMELESEPVNISIAFPFFTRTKILDSPPSSNNPWSNMPRFAVEEPAKVVAQIIKETDQGRPYIFPGPVSPVLSFLNRVFPPAVHMLRKVAGA